MLRFVLNMAQRASERVSKKQLDMFQKVVEKFLPGWHEGAGGNKTREEAPQKPLPEVETLAKIVKLPEPTNHDHALVSIPIVRHWLFAPDGTRQRYREFQVEAVHRHKQIIQTIRIGDRFTDANKNYGVLTTRHQRAIFALQEIWQEQGGRVALVDGIRRGILSASSWSLEEALFGHHGGRTKRLVRQIIQELASIPVAIDNYVASNREIYDLDVTGLIAGAEFRSSRRINNSQLGFPWVEIYLSSIVTRAFEERAVKPINVKVLNDLGSGVSALLYPKVDYYLSTNTENEMRCKGLVEKLGLQNKQLHQFAYRRRKFQTIAEELDGQPLSISNYVIDARLEPTADGKDYKLITARKKK